MIRIQNIYQLVDTYIKIIIFQINQIDVCYILNIYTFYKELCPILYTV